MGPSIRYAQMGPYGTHFIFILIIRMTLRAHAELRLEQYYTQYYIDSYFWFNSHIKY